MPATEIRTVANFITDEECDILVQAFENSRLINSRNTYWDDMVVYPAGISDRSVLRLMAATSARTREVITSTYATDAIFSDSIMLCRWDVGKYLTPHIDNQDASENSTPWRDFSSLVYLNDDYQGGEIFFPRVDVTLKPDRGTLVLFSSGPEHEHGVREVTAGRRYTMPSWYTRDESHKNELHVPRLAVL